MRILLLLNDTVLTSKILHHFAPFACVFEVFKDASTVFDAIYKKSYDVVILSIEAPDFEALELTKQIRENKIILQSARHCHFDTDENIIYLKNKFVYDLNKYRLSKNNLVITLTSKENKIIQYLVKNICRSCAVEEIAEILSDEKFVNCTTVRMHIKRIRDKCGSKLIESTKGLGYHICRDKPE
ncbi:MAG: DNA-binding response regulator [Proteobacteria bacterium]|nr:DNA-binding response regulator [Pseudomonadota bacterium]